MSAILTIILAIAFLVVYAMSLGHIPHTLATIGVCLLIGQFFFAVSAELEKRR